MTLCIVECGIYGDAYGAEYESTLGLILGTIDCIYDFDVLGIGIN